jgi:hypothetical protein
MPVFSATQVMPQPSQVATLAAPARFGSAQTVRAPTMAATLTAEPFPDLHFSAAQTVAADRQAVRLVPATWRGPAEARPPGVPATPRPL